jgi:hypothetical protein
MGSLQVFDRVITDSKLSVSCYLKKKVYTATATTTTVTNYYHYVILHSGWGKM